MYVVPDRAVPMGRRNGHLHHLIRLVRRYARFLRSCVPEARAEYASRARAPGEARE